MEALLEKEKAKVFVDRTTSLRDEAELGPKCVLVGTWDTTLGVLNISNRFDSSFCCKIFRRLKAYPKGNNIDNYLSLFLAVANAEYLQFGWKRHAKVSFTVVNQLSEELSQVIESREHLFGQKVSVWGCKRIINNGKLKSKNGGFLVNGEVKIVVEIDVLSVIGELDVLEETEEATPTPPPLKKKLHQRVFEKHPDVALEVHQKNPLLKTAYMNVLLSLTETLCRSPRAISKDDLADAYDSVTSLKDVGFKLDWLEKKLNKVPEKKEKEEACEARMLEMEKELKYLKAKVLAARAPRKRLTSCPWLNGKTYYFSVRLDVVNSETLPREWRIQAKCRLTVVNQLSEKLSQVQEREYWFNRKNNTLCFLEMLPLSKLHDKDGGFAVNGEVKIVLEVEVLEVIGNLDISEDGEEITQEIIERVDVNGFEVVPSKLIKMQTLLNFQPKEMVKIVKAKKKEEQKGVARVQELEEEVKDFNQTCSDIEALLEKKKQELKDLKQKCSEKEALLEKEKGKVLAARTPPLTLDDAV
ncbi:unnamed protein product [Arabis nemorensis]|uniref:MATH domain-containing protein n=1 Tax=Arabis nemorensis TaxID=586526 RepID=A0A565BXT0_9BRAS|nr:unnamed protein product [Arabis nemorensis]